MKYMIVVIYDKYDRSVRFAHSLKEAHEIFDEEAKKPYEVYLTKIVRKKGDA